ncbi:hypothetical protein QQF64_024084 [Cirrhinus molitorella]|uniref:Uncharacterized protein n=1 Tax=Cirrhinus molitorella TaxID=172907 RepID=A0ABR3NKU1_9TELE
MPALTNLPVVRSWTAADTALCLSTAIGYALTLGLAFILYRKVNEMQESVGRCTRRRSPGPSNDNAGRKARQRNLRSHSSRLTRYPRITARRTNETCSLLESLCSRQPSSVYASAEHHRLKKGGM